MKNLILVLTLSLLLAGCASTQNTSEGKTAYRVGPQSSANAKAVESPNQVVGNKNAKLSVIVPVVSANLPKDSDDYKKKNIWPELRYAEGNRFANHLKEALEKTNSFDSVRVYPDSSATAELYVSGKIVKSNGEDIAMEVQVVDISGKQRLPKKVYKHRVKEYDTQDPRKKSVDLYAPLFDKVAADVARVVKRIRKNDVAELDVLEKVRFGESLSAEYFSKYLKRSSNGRVRLISAPSYDDPMMKNLEAIRVKDQFFTDEIQKDYTKFSNKMDKHYLAWQRQAFGFAKHSRIARQKATNKAIFGTILAVAGGVAANNAASYGSTLAATTALLAGGALIFDSMDDATAAKEHKEGLNELGQSLNIEMVDKNIELEGRQVQLKGDASEQATTWRQVLREYYQETMTPEISL